MPTMMLRRMNLLRVLLIAPVLVLSGCVLAFVNLFRFSSSGEISIVQPTGETQHLIADVCRAGELSAFNGFDIASSNGAWQIRALIDPLSGPAVRIAASSMNTTLRQEDCSVLAIDARPSGVSINDVNSYDGFVNLNCSTSDGVRIEGRVDVHNCPGGYMNGPLNSATASTASKNAGDIPTDADLARIRGEDVVDLQSHRETPSIPASIRGLHVFVTYAISGKKTGNLSDTQIQGNCAKAVTEEFALMDWRVVPDAAQPHDLIAHGECTTSAQFLTKGGTMYVLLPPSEGMRFDTNAGERIEQLQPMAKTLKCPGTDRVQCAAAIREYSHNRVVEQIVNSVPLANYTAHLARAR